MWSPDFRIRFWPHFDERRRFCNSSHRFCIRAVLRIQAFLILDVCTHATRPPKSAYLAKRGLFFAHRSTFTSGHEICFHGLIPAENSCLGLVQFRKDRLWHPNAEFFSTASTKPLSVHVRGPLLSKNRISWFRV